ncbi:MAG: ankyrin repeat domain-containing protein [Spirochaetes bacterium]|nr:ankyrin repeat domain-containing protein [Spirochaetota bacterium]
MKTAIMYVTFALSIAFFCAAAQPAAKPPALTPEDKQLFAELKKPDANKDRVSYIVKSGASLTAVDKDGKTPLIVAAEMGHALVVDAWLRTKAKPDVNIQDKTGMTAMMYAAKNGFREVVAMLLSNNADAWLKDVDGKTAFIYATERGDEETITMLASIPKPAEKKEAAPVTSKTNKTATTKKK